MPTENPRRLIMVSEKHGDEQKWLPPTYSLFQETPYTFKSIEDFNCKPDRGRHNKPMFLINHWLRPTARLTRRPPKSTPAGCSSTGSEGARRPQGTPERDGGGLHGHRRPLHRP